MAEEVVRELGCEKGGVFVDLTVGEGGHGERILRSYKDTVLVGLDWDGEIIERARERLKGYEGRVFLFRENFLRFPLVLESLGIEEVDGVLLDLGPSLFHFQRGERGFSLYSDGPLDMRMDRRRALDAHQVVNLWPLQELQRVIREYGDERWARRIVRAIAKRREEGGVKGTKELAELIERAIPRRYWPKKIHPATKTFLALRIAVNEELENLRGVLEIIPSHLRKGGRLCVISFHSLEHRIVKETLGRLSKDCICPPWFPQCCCGGGKQILRVLTPSPLTPADKEVRENPRARSAQLRVAERV